MPEFNTGVQFPFPGTRSCPRCGKPEHGSAACEWAAPWPTVEAPPTPEVQATLDVATELRALRIELAGKLDDTLKKLREEVEKERWMKETAARDALSGETLPFKLDDYLEMLEYLYETTQREE